jgi:hypothetical protein
MCVNILIDIQCYISPYKRVKGFWIDLFTKLFIGIAHHETASLVSWWTALGSDRFYSNPQVLSLSSTENFSLPA